MHGFVSDTILEDKPGGLSIRQGEDRMQKNSTNQVIGKGEVCSVVEPDLLREDLERAGGGQDLDGEKRVVV